MAQLEWTEARWGEGVADASVIWLHGLGADGHDFVPVVPALGLPADWSVRFLFPHAPYQPVTCNGGYEMRSWYDILSLAPESREIDEDGLLRTCAAVHALIEHEMARGVRASRIVLAGFSQGGAVAYTAGLTARHALAGVIAPSTYLPAPHRVHERPAGAAASLPIFAGHGSEDDVVSPALGLRARETLSALGYRVEWHSYRMDHAVCPEEVRDIGVWLTRVLG